MDRFEEMETFVRVVDAGSITKAADQLDVAKSAVSRRLSDLENRLGAQLLVRTTRKIQPTETGLSYYDQSLRLLNDLDEIEAAAADSRCALSGNLRVSVPLSFGLAHLHPVIESFIEQNPDIAFDIDLSDRHINLVEENIDVAIRAGELQDSQLMARKLFPVQTIACASPDYWARHGVPETADDLSRYEMLNYSLGSDSRLSYTGPDGKTGQIRPGVRHQANNGEFLRNMAIAGRGFIIIPLFIVCDAIGSGQLVPVLKDHTWNEINAYAVYPSTRHLSRRVRSFIDHLVTSFEHDRPWEACMACGY